VFVALSCAPLTASVDCVAERALRHVASRVPPVLPPSVEAAPPIVAVRLSAPSYCSELFAVLATSFSWPKLTASPALRAVGHVGHALRRAGVGGRSVLAHQHQFVGLAGALQRADLAVVDVRAQVLQVVAQVGDVLVGREQLAAVDGVLRARGQVAVGHVAQLHGVRRWRLAVGAHAAQRDAGGAGRAVRVLVVLHRVVGLGADRRDRFVTCMQLAAVDRVGRRAGQLAALHVGQLLSRTGGGAGGARCDQRELAVLARLLDGADRAASDRGAEVVERALHRRRGAAADRDEGRRGVDAVRVGAAQHVADACAQRRSAGRR
jgi:hypothetical protein